MILCRKPIEILNKIEQSTVMLNNVDSVFENLHGCHAHQGKVLNFTLFKTRQNQEIKKEKSEISILKFLHYFFSVTSIKIFLSLLSKKSGLQLKVPET